MAGQIDTSYIDPHNPPPSLPKNGDEILNQAYKDAVDKITSVQKSTGKALTQMKLKVYKEVIAKYDALRKMAEEAEKMASAREAVNWALTQLKTEDYKEILSKNKVVLKPDDFYLGLVRKESGFDQQAESNKEGKKDKEGNVSQARGLFQILVKTNPEGTKSCKPIEDVNKFYGLEANLENVYYRGDDKEARTIAARNNALVGILFWHRCYDYGKNLKSDWSADDKDKLANMIYNMGVGGVTNISKEMDVIDEKDKDDKAPGNFKELMTKLAKKLHEAYPEDLENKEETVVDPVLGVSYTSYLKIGKKFDKDGKEMSFNGKNVSLGKIFEAIKYAELVFNLNHSQPQQQVPTTAPVAPAAVPAKTPAQAPTVAIATPKAPASIPAPLAENVSETTYILGENNKWFWGIANDVYEKNKIDDAIHSPEWISQTKTDKINTIMAAVFSYNKSKNNPEFMDVAGDNIKLLAKGTNVFEPPRDYVLKFINDSLKPKTPASAPEKPEKPVKYEKVGPMHILKGQSLGIIDSFMPSILTIDTSGVKEKIEFKQVVDRSADAKSGKKFEHDQIQVKVGNLSGFFQMEGHKNLSYGPFPFDKGGLWDKYSIHMDNEKNVIKIALTKPLETSALESKPATVPKAPEKQKVKDYLDPDQPLDLSWPDGVEKHIPKKGEIIYIGKDGAKLMDDGKKLYQTTEVPRPEFKTPKWMNENEGIDHWEKMPKVNGVVFHATEGLYQDASVDQSGTELFEKHSTHFLIKRNGDIWVVRNPGYRVNHTGRYQDSGKKALWDGDEEPFKDKIGIEVETYHFYQMIDQGLMLIPADPANVHKRSDGTYYTTDVPKQSDINKAWVQAGKYRNYSDDQYIALKSLSKYLGYKNELTKQSFLPHSMIACGHIYGQTGIQRSRKFDPCNLDYSRLEMPNNFRIVDPDVARGNLKYQRDQTEGEKKGKYPFNYPLSYDVRKKGDAYYYVPSDSFGSQSFMDAGLKAGQQLCEEFEGCKVQSDNDEVKLKAENYNLTDDELENNLKEGKIITDSNMTVYEAIKHNINKEATIDIVKDQRLVEVLYYSFDNKVHKGQVVIHRKLANDIQQIFALAYEMKFPIGKVIPISNPNYNWDDIKSVTDNNSSSFNYRNIAGSDSLSDHSEGRAIDINPLLNPFIEVNGKATPAKAVYDPKVPGTLTADHPIVKKFLELGWEWGGNWKKNVKDYQHFSKKPKKP